MSKKNIRIKNSLIKNILILSTVLVYHSSVFGLDINGNPSLYETAEPVALYLFDEPVGSSVIKDKITSNGSLDLTIDNAASSVQLGGGALEIITPTAIRSTGPATKIIQACKASNEIAIEAWIESNTQNDLSLALYGPARILTLSTGMVKPDLKSNSVGFFVGQTYDAGHQYVLGVNTRQSVNTNNMSLDLAGAVLNTDASNKNIVRQSQLQHIYFIKNKDGLARIFSSEGNSNTAILRAEMTLQGASLAQLDVNSILSLGNEPKYNNDSGLEVLSKYNSAFGNRTIEDKDWRGKYHMLAIYCKAPTNEQIFGSLAPTDWLIENIAPVTVDLNQPVSENLKLARIMYNRLTGINLPLFHPHLKQMEILLSSDSTSIANRIKAAQIATNKPVFYNNTIKLFAKKMSNRDHLVSIPLNDFTASFIGVTRDNIDARELLRGDFYYMADSTKAAVPSVVIDDMIMSNRHYEQLEKLNYDLSSVLVKVNGQVYYDGASKLIPAFNYDVAGVLTSRQWLAEHAVAGTNRRLIEYAFSEFLCRPITAWADNTQPDNFVGRDVDRFPTAVHEKYQISCRGCHAQMDALRGAFARLTFETNFVKHAWVVSSDADNDPNNANNNVNIRTMIQVPKGVSGKYNKNNDMFPPAKETQDTSWENYVVGAENAAYFGWSPQSIPPKENRRGVKAFGNMLAESKAFSTCMTERAFSSVCKRDPKDFDRTLIENVAASFRSEDQYNLKKLFERMVSQPECLGL